MKKLIGVIVAVALLALPLMAMAGPTGLHLNWGSEVNAGQSPGGKLVINVTHKVTNDLDSGELGQWWAYDNYNRHIQVWQIGTNTFCAVVRYVGHFITVAGPSPGGTDLEMAAGIKGTMTGGYRGTVTGTLKFNRDYRTKGNIGSFDYQGDPDLIPPLGRTNAWNWIDEYFEGGWAFTYDWWGWVYRAGKNGTWVNAISGNEGDITD